MKEIVFASRVNFHIVVVLLLVPSQSAISLFEQCNHVVELSAGQKIYINSPYYPADYPIGTSCRYTVVAPLDHELNFKCSIDLNVDSTAPQCQTEVFYFNGEGSEILTESDYHCGSAQIERKSFLNRAVISYISQPIFQRNLFATPTPYTSKHLHDIGAERNASSTENSSFSTTLMPELTNQENNFSNPFIQFTELLASNADISDDNTSTIISSTTENLPDPTTASVEQTNVNGTLRRSRIVTPNFNVTDSQYYGYGENRGGGRFTCLIEVIEPPCDCGWTVSLKIAGATGVAGLNEFPSMAALKTVRFNTIFCGAAIIHHRYLISAAHCFIAPEANQPDLIRVVVGEIDLSTVLESLYSRTYEVEAIIPNESFYASSRNVRNDIALLRTRTPIEWNRSVGPACLPFRFFNLPGSDAPRRQPLPGQYLDTVGWGTTTFGGTQSMQLLKTTLKVFSTAQCRKVLRFVPSGIFCTFSPGHDTCQYDSGGALYGRNDRLFAVGIISYGFACAAQRPSVHTRIASFLKWIQAKSPEVNYCVK